MAADLTDSTEEPHRNRSVSGTRTDLNRKIIFRVDQIDPPQSGALLLNASVKDKYVVTLQAFILHQELVRMKKLKTEAKSLFELPDYGMYNDVPSEYQSEDNFSEVDIFQQNPSFQHNLPYGYLTTRVT
ncbi:hypothetical protein OUZ56_005761 [Daphnia magna]|uniref:Uncharacterized protein n=1 Tax=Daphnia magna TaxID=35525 RepID=A0ABQ9YTP6_9CRUS|nr:hypothetical protein OUZ56_005761 [Daphnia magna]